MPRLGELLSQHGLLTAICECISGADVANLAATCTEYRTYITSSKPIYDKLMSSTICSGKGLGAQEKIFGPRDTLLVIHEDETDHEIKNPREKRCLGVDCRPCSACGFRVCDDCRFHFLYPFAAGQDADEHTELEEEMVEDYLIEYFGPSGRVQSKVEYRKAIEIFCFKRSRFYCADCEPPLLPDQYPYDVCRCNLYKHWVGNRWLCLPCFFEEEAEAQKVADRRVTGYHPTDGSYRRKRVCACGAASLVAAAKTCRLCTRAISGPLPDRTDIVYQKLLDQLGHQTEREGMLAQLG